MRAPCLPIPAVAVLGFAVGLTAVRLTGIGYARVVADLDSFHRDDFGGDDRAFGVQHDRVFLFGEVPGLNVLSIGLGDRDPLAPGRPGETAGTVSGCRPVITASAARVGWAPLRRVLPGCPAAMSPVPSSSPPGSTLPGPFMP